MTDSLVDGFSRSIRQDLLTWHLLCFPRLPRFYRKPTVIRTNCTEPCSLSNEINRLSSLLHPSVSTIDLRRLHPSVKVVQHRLAVPSITKVPFARCHRAEDVSCNKVRVALQQVSSDKHWANLICLDTRRSFSVRLEGRASNRVQIPGHRRRETRSDSTWHLPLLRTMIDRRICRDL